MRQSGEHFRLLVESVQDYGIFMLDPQGRIASWNAGAERIKGYAEEEARGKHFSLFYTPEDVERRYPEYELEVAARDGRFEDEGWRVRKDGSRFWANVVITALRNEDGHLVGFGKVTRDLTERKRAEEEREALFERERQARLHAEEFTEELQNQSAQLEENQVELEMANEDLQRANAELGAAEAHYRRLVETSPHGVYVLDAEGRFKEMNAAGERILGRSSSEMLGRHFGPLVAPEDLDLASDAFVRVMSGADESLEFDLSIQRPSGERRLVDVVITPIRDHGEITGIHGVFRDITEERRTQESLRESEGSYRSLFDSLTELVYIQDVQGRFLNVNEAALRRYGYSREEILSRTPDVLIDPERTDITSVQNHLRQASRGEPRHFEAWGRTKEGETFPKEVTLTRGRYFGEEVVIAVARDISERKQAEEERHLDQMLLGAEQRILERISQVEPLPQILDALVREIEQQIDDTLCSVLLVHPESHTLHPGAAPHLPEAYSSAIEGVLIEEGRGSCGTAAYRNEPVITADIQADPLWRDYRELAQEHGLAACWSHPIRASDGSILGTFGIYSPKVRKPSPHERRVVGRAAHLAALAIERTRSIEALRKSEERFQIVAELTNDAIWEVDPATGRILWNARFEAVFGGTADNLQAWAERILPEDRERVGSSFDALLEHHGSTWAAEYRFLRSDGSYVHVYDRAQVVYSEEGIPVRIIGAMMDISERRRAEDREKELLHAQATRALAEAANRAKNEFLSRMSHELRTPLNAILGFGQILELDVEAQADRESVEQILKAGEHLLRLVDDVLDIARIEAGQMSLSVEPVSVRSVLQESLDLVRLTAAKQRVALRAQDALTSEHVVQADQQRLKQVLLNLLSNAIKYNRAEGAVTLSCEEVGEDRLRIGVRDTGYGIPAQKLERLFTPFDRLGAEQTGVEGTGLGLALSKGLVEAMGGRLSVESVEGEGSRFWVELGLAPRRTVPEAVPGKRQVDVPGEAVGVRHTVLFVEDNLANVRLMERIFERRPQVRLLTAMQGSLGLELAREHHPDLILLDLNLPDLSGDKVLLRLRKDPALRAIPVLMISGDAIPSQAQRMLALGAQAYLTKPFDVHELLRIVDENLQTEKRKGV